MGSLASCLLFWVRQQCFRFVLKCCRQATALVQIILFRSKALDEKYDIGIILHNKPDRGHRTHQHILSENQRAIRATNTSAASPFRHSTLVLQAPQTALGSHQRVSGATQTLCWRWLSTRQTCITGVHPDHWQQISTIRRADIRCSQIPFRKSKQLWKLV